MVCRAARFMRSHKARMAISGSVRRRAWFVSMAFGLFAIEVLIRQGKTAQAYEKDLDILKSNPKDAEARGLKASFLLDKGDIDAAIVELTRDNYPDTVAFARQALQANPDDAVAHDLLGLGLGYQSHFDEAIPEFQRAVQLSPADVDFQQHLAAAERNLHRH